VNGEVAISISYINMREIRTPIGSHREKQKRYPKKRKKKKKKVL